MKENDEINVYCRCDFLVRWLQFEASEWRLWDLMWGLHIMDWETRDETVIILGC